VYVRVCITMRVVAVVFPFHATASRPLDKCTMYIAPRRHLGSSRHADGSACSLTAKQSRRQNNTNAESDTCGKSIMGHGHWR